MAAERAGSAGSTGDRAPGSRAAGRVAPSGIILLDKPTGLSSNTALQRVRRACGADKAGHAGTLDPLATGMLPILLGEATKIAGYLLHKDKAYRVECRLGQTTTTYDSEGDIVEERAVPAIDPDALRAHLDSFTGRIRQQAPVYSAIKQGGQPLYKRARRGEDVVAPVREVVVHRIDVEPPAAAEGNGVADVLTLIVHCGSGTYIRSLVHDLGQALGCGAHVTALRRLWVDPFRDAPMTTLDAVLAGEATLQPPLAGLADWPMLALAADELAAIGQGRRLARVADEGLLAGIAPDGDLAAILESDGQGAIRPLRVLNRPA
jgi:tRNA pseudouridine55 synthase